MTAAGLVVPHAGLAVGVIWILVGAMVAWGAARFVAVASKDDPVRHCDVYTQLGCAHVDGFLCDMKTCPMLEKHRADKGLAAGKNQSAPE